MNGPFSRIIGKMIYRKASNYTPKKEIPTAPEVKSYDPIKSLIDSRNNRTRPRRTPRQYSPDNCQVCGKVLMRSETYVCRKCDEEPLEFEEIGRVRAEEQE
jgi:hypothetical protein